jgi:hypothetical protein
MVYSNNFNQVRVGVRNGVVTQVVNAVDADATAFIAAAGITNLTQAAAISTLVNDLKTYGLWTKMKALYPMVGGTAASHKFNLKDPRDLDAAFRLVFNGGWTHTSNGALPNGTTGYADTKLTPSVNLGASSAHFSYYSRTATTSDSNNYVIGAGNGYGFTAIILRNNTKFFRHTINNSSFEDAKYDGALSTSGLFLGTQDGTNTKLFRNATIINQNFGTDPRQDRVNIPLFIGAENVGGTSGTYTTAESSFASIGDGLTDTEATNFYNSVQKFQTTLGRQIGSPIVSDTDAQAFINAAGLTDLGQANAVNTLVVDLKAAGVWTKMKALYPFVGGTATSHKFNLKDPRDLDAAYRLVFNGGWTHSSTGALPNGSNAYAHSKFIPLNNTTDYNAHLSYYSRTNNTTSGVDIGSFSSLSNYWLQLWTSNFGGVSRTTIQRDDTNQAMFASTTRQGFFIGGVGLSGFNSFSKIYQDGVLKNTNNVNLNITRSNTSIYLGALNIDGVAGAFANRESAFASIGDGLSDVEAVNFYTAVQKYQTSLSRQIGTPVLESGQTANLLDTYSSAAAAYSLRKLRTGYYGFAIRVRRSSDNLEQDISFDTNGVLDTTSLLAFIGNGNGFVTTWYDQSGNISNLIQTTAANQARIVYNGLLDTLNGKPALVTNYNYSTSGFYKATYSSTINGPATVFNIGSNVASTGVSYLWDGLNTNNMYAYSYNNTWMRIGGSAEFALTGYTQGITTQRIINAIYNGSSSKLRINNGTYATGNTGTIAATGLTLGGVYNGGYLAPAYNQEHIVYPSNQETNATNINTNINSYYSIY